jgi:hypothetical protein
MDVNNAHSKAVNDLEVRANAILRSLCAVAQALARAREHRQNAERVCPAECSPEAPSSKHHALIDSVRARLRDNCKMPVYQLGLAHCANRSMVSRGVPGLMQKHLAALTTLHPWKQRLFGLACAHQRQPSQLARPARIAMCHTTPRRRRDSAHNHRITATFVTAVVCADTAVQALHASDQFHLCRSDYTSVRCTLPKRPLCHMMTLMCEC